jgi:hypothetical protein
MRRGSTSNGYFFPKRYVRKVRARKRTQGDLLTWLAEQREQQALRDADNFRIAKMLIAVYGEDECRKAIA